MKWKAYEAEILSAKVAGIRPPDSVESIIKWELYRQRGPVKREEIVHWIVTATGIDKPEVVAHIAGVLRKLEKEGWVVRSKKTGYWQFVEERLKGA